MLILGSPFALVPGTMRSAIEMLGLTSGLKLCLDASDFASYTGSGQSWLDTSGNGYDFYRGSTAASQATDPTFNGTAGGQSASEYWSFDGGDYFTYDSSNETWMDNINKNNAIFTLALWAYATAASVAVAGTYTPTLSRGCWDVAINAGPILRFNVYNASDRALIMDTSAAVPLNAWVFLGITMNEGASAATMQINGTQEAKSPTYSSPLANGSDLALKLGAEGDGSFPLASGSRLHSFMAWEGTALSAAQMLSLYESTKLRFGH